MTSDARPPSLSTIVDQLTVRIEYAEAQGLDAERAALNTAREALLDHVLHPIQHETLIAIIVHRLRRAGRRIGVAP